MSELKDAIDEVVYTAQKNMHTSLPGIITEFNASLQTVTVALAINRIIGGVSVKITPLLDLPIILPTAGGWHFTFPIKPGDECLVVFAERAIDNWFVKGGQQLPIEERVHDISDGFALIGVNSTPNVIPGYNTDGMELRNEANDQRITFNSDGSISVSTENSIDVHATSDITINTDSSIDITAASDITINTDSNIDITAATQVSLTCPNTIITSTVAVLGSLSINGIILETHTHDQESDSHDSTEQPVGIPRNP